MGCPAVSPRCPQGWQCCPGCHGRTPGWGRQQRMAAKFWGSRREGGRGEASRRPCQGWPCVPGGSPAGPGALPARSRRAGTEAPALLGIADSGNLPELFTARSEPSFQGCNAKPPLSLCRDIHTPPAPYAACALTQEVGTGSCHLLCHRAGHEKPGRGRGRHPERKKREWKTVEGRGGK